MLRAALVMCAFGAVCAHELYRDASQPIPVRVADLLGRMTPEEKQAQLVMKQGGTVDSVEHDFGSTGIGSWGLSHKALSDAVGQRNRLQAGITNSSRLHIPVSFFAEILHGSIGGTVFPMPVSLASAWNPDLITQVYKVVAKDARAVGIDIGYAPVINMWTDARFGRLQEGFSSNPTLSAHFATASVLGLQGSLGQSPNDYLNPVSEVVAVGKHAMAYGAAAGGLNAGPADITNLTFLEVYAKPWKAFAKAGGRGAMASHNTVNGVPSHANRWMLTDLFRGSFGFENGIIVSDCNDIGVLTDYRIATNKTHAAARGLVAGVDYDLQCGSDPSQWSYNNALSAISDGLVSQADFDTAVSRVLTSKFASGMFDSPNPDPSALKNLNSAADQQLALKAVEQSVVLLKNSADILPLDATAHKQIAVIGPSAGCNKSTSDAENWLGSYYEWSSGGNHDGVNVTFFWDAVRAAVPSDVTVTCNVGAGADQPGSQQDIDAAVAAAKAADLVLLAIGDTPHTCGEWGDANSLDLPGNQLALLAALAAVGKPTVAVLVNGRPLTFGQDNAALGALDAVIEAWRPGQMGAAGVANVLFGSATPQGKLAHSFPRSTGAVRSGAAPWLQAVQGKWIANNRGVVDADGRHYDDYSNAGLDSGSPLFYFGYGLSYTTFSYSGLSAKLTGDSESPVAVTFTVTNTGAKRAGVEVAQVYVTDPVGVRLAAPFWKRLAGSALTTSLAPGNAEAITVKISADDLAMYDDSMQFGIIPGTYVFSVGGASNADSLSAGVDLK